MKPQLQQIEVEPVWGHDHDLAVEYGPRGQPIEQAVMQLREIPVKRPQVSTLDVDVGFTAEDDGAASVPFWLKEKMSGSRQSLGQLGQHRLNGRGNSRGLCLGAGTHNL